MARHLSVKASSRRWLVHTFYNILDLAAINAFVMYKAVTGEKLSRKVFLQKLSEELRLNYLKTKSYGIEPVPELYENNLHRSTKRHNCQEQGNCKRNKTREMKSSAGKWFVGNALIE
jgi:hypothetical protein